MNPFAYLSVLTSIILGLGIARLLTGLGRLLQARGRVHVYWVQFLWSVNLFLYMVLVWWVLFRWQGQQSWTFFLFLFVLLAPTVTFLEAVLLVPDPLPEGVDLEQHFWENHRAFFLLGALLLPLDAIDTALKGLDHFAAQGPLYVVTILLLTILNLIAAYNTRESFHRAYAVFFLVYLIFFIGINLRVLA